MKESVSVVVPTYNRPGSLHKALITVLAQDFSTFEVLVINDSKDDKPVQNVLELLNDPRIRYLRNDGKKGANGARNTGIRNAKTNFIAFLDDDDEWLPQKLKWQFEYIKKHPEACGVFSAYKIQTRWGWITKSPAITKLSLPGVLLNTISIGSSSNLLFRREIFDKVGLWDEDLKRQQDLELLARITNSAIVGFDPRISLKVMGHNDPNAEKAIRGHKEYYHKVLPLVQLLDQKDQKRFHSNHFRRLAMYRIRTKNYKEVRRLYKSALNYEFLHPRKDIKNLALFLKGIFGTEQKKVDQNLSHII